MALQLAQKQEIVAAVRTAADEALAAVLADYRGLSVEELTGLRRQARKDGVYLRVVRNTLLRRAVAGTEYECLAEAASGPTMLAFSRTEPGAAARLLRTAAAQHDALDVKAVAIGGRLFPPADIDRLAALPTREEALAQLLGVLKAPVAKLAQTLREVPAKLVRTLAAVGERSTGDAGGTAPGKAT